MFFYIYLPETKDVPLEDIQDLFVDDDWGRYRHSYRPVMTTNIYGNESSGHDASMVRLTASFMGDFEYSTSSDQHGLQSLDSSYCNNYIHKQPLQDGYRERQ